MRSVSCAMHTGLNDVQPGEVVVTNGFGDIVVADGDGVAFIPRNRLATVARLAERKLADEAAKREKFREGSP